MSVAWPMKAPNNNVLLPHACMRSVMQEYGRVPMVMEKSWKMLGHGKSWKMIGHGKVMEIAKSWKKVMENGTGLPSRPL